MTKRGALSSNHNDETTLPYPAALDSLFATMTAPLDQHFPSSSAVVLTSNSDSDSSALGFRRVSSRQRLVSWDSFDATNIVVDSGEESGEFDADAVQDYYEQLYSGSTASTSPSTTTTPTTSDLDVTGKRKRSLSRRRLLHHILPHALHLSRSKSDPKISAAANNSTTQSCSPWMQALPEVLLHVCSFLDVADVTQLSHTNHQLRDLLVSSTEAHDLWNDMCVRQWPFLKDSTNDIHITKDHSEEPTMVTLLHWATPTPDAVDTSLLNCSRWNRTRSRHVSGTDSPMLAMRMSHSLGRPVVAFSGRVGHGGRCIRANAPLPRPHTRIYAPSHSRFPYFLRRRPFPYHFSNTHTAPMSYPLHMTPFQQAHHHHARDTPMLWKPFVAPYRKQDGTMSLTPRLVSYYEVTIVSMQGEEDDHDSLRLNSMLLQRRHSGLPDCVAVGLATDAFSGHTRMPGWDVHSFGFHSDDGGIFHARGEMLKSFGPTFGIGDTVGCGIDYLSHCIFYTLNGRLLGPAFSGTPESLTQQALYPVVGMDTRGGLDCNFGIDRPFVYDLDTLVQQQQDVIHEWMHGSNKHQHNHASSLVSPHA
jgi:hypothetical protein